MSTTKRRGRRRASGLARTALQIGVVFALVVLTAQGTDAQQSPAFERRSLDGSGNNRNNPTWGQTNVQYRRNAAARYADGIARQVSGPEPRSVSNRIFNDVSQNLFSENRVSQWGFTWGQFLDHTFGLRQTAGGENSPLAFNANDPLESFRNDFGNISFARSAAAPGTGVTTPRQQTNTVDSYID